MRCLVLKPILTGGTLDADGGFKIPKTVEFWKQLVDECSAKGFKV